MSQESVHHLPWLKKPPADFQAQCKQIGAGAQDTAVFLRRLANHALDDNDLHRLSKTIAKEKKRTGQEHIDGLKPYCLGLVSNGTANLVTPCLIATAVRYGIDLEIVAGEFDQAFHEATAPASKVKSAQPDGVLIALDYRGIPGLDAGLADDEERCVNEALDYIGAVCRGLQQETQATLFVQNVACPTGTLFGSLDARLPGSQRRRIELFNQRLSGLLAEFSGILLDVDGLARTVGYENWFVPVQWHMAKLPFAHEFSPIYAEHAMRLIGAVRGVSRKCLVLDLDNTLWGGVVGDDGVHGLVLGQGDALGEAFIAIQRIAKMLLQRGIVLAVCSKNDDEVARSAFRDHPDMLLREEDFAVFQANWRDKASNLEAIAKALNIGTEALVFLDDNPAEREQVRQVLPEVAVPELTDDPSDYPMLLLSAGYFESVSFTEDDSLRAGQYRANAERAQLAEEVRDMNEYLVSLAMVMKVAPFDATGRSRIAQLTNRSNQFNLTTRRYDEAAIAAFEQRPDAFTLQVRLEDRFGDNGMISVIICVANGTDWVIDTWLMSCRVLNRGVEEAVLDVLAEKARSHGIARIEGHYIPTEKNGLVKEHYPKLGFKSAGRQDGMDVWHLDLADYEARNPPIEVVTAEAMAGA